jgi:glycosyltransferase involved in cell wall biosynthesis
VLEAMAAGVPVACSDIPSLREIAGPTVLYFDPASEDHIASALLKLARNPDGELVSAARRRAAGFTWERTAQATLKILLSQT